MKLDTFTRAYIEAALWSSTDDNDKPLDANYSISDLAEPTLASMIGDCERFQTECANDITEDNRVFQGAEQVSIEELAGHDFWLTRCGHGAGFWDGDWAEPAATHLDEAAKRFGNVDLYVGDDGKIYS